MSQRPSTSSAPTLTTAPPPGAALLRFAARLHDPHQALLLWAPGTHPCGDAATARAWPGVECDERAGSVVALDLSSRGLGGTLDASLAELATLRSM